MTRRKRLRSHLVRIAPALALLLVVGTGCAEKEEAPLAPAVSGEISSENAVDEAGVAEKTVAPAGYNPAADPVADLAAAVAEASGRRILLEVGGEWCSWCHILEDYIHATPAVAAAMEKNYVVLKVNYSEENENEEFLSGYPEIEGYPHIFVLESDGSLLQSQNTGELEAGKGYDTELFLAFLRRWSPA